MARALERFQPDVVHCHNIYHQLSPSILAPVRRAGVRCVMTLHDYKLACPSYQMLDHGRLCDACVEGSLLNAARRRCKSGSSPPAPCCRWNPRSTASWAPTTLSTSSSAQASSSPR